MQPYNRLGGPAAITTASENDGLTLKPARTTIPCIASSTTWTANLFVEAGAGTGKTYALVSRVVALVKAGVEMENIVAITFTEAAAAELSERIRTRMELLLDDGHPDNASDLLHDGLNNVERSRIRDAIADLDQASIQTIHSFAAQLLRERPLDVGLPPGWTPWDDLAASEHFRERWGSWLEWILGDGDDVPAELRNALYNLLARGVGLAHWRATALDFSRSMDQLRGPDSVKFDIGEVDLSDASDEIIRELRGLCELDRNRSGRSASLLEPLNHAIAVVQCAREVFGRRFCGG